MIERMRASLCVVLTLLLGACAAMQPSAPTMSAEQARAVVQNPVRTDRDRQMDASRKPVEFLAFSQVGPGMRVLDVSAGGGYTTQIMALAVGPAGKVWAHSPNPGQALTKRLADHPQANVIVVKRPFEDPVPEDASGLDVVTLVNNYHDISYLPVDRAAMNRKLFAALKPGGRYIVMDHAAAAESGISAGKSLHRIDEALVRDEVQQAGFVLDGEATFLRNPSDTRDKPSTAAEQTSDKFLLRFVKPR
jgi:predicted methyltransferase